MRKGKTRRRHASSPTKSSQSSAGQSPKDANSNEAGAVERKQTATENEAILTSKNFRLARELVSFRILGIIFPYSNLNENLIVGIFTFTRSLTVTSSILHTRLYWIE